MEGCLLSKEHIKLINTILIYIDKDLILIRRYTKLSPDQTLDLFETDQYTIIKPDPDHTKIPWLSQIWILPNTLIYPDLDPSKIP